MKSSQHSQLEFMLLQKEILTGKVSIKAYNPGEIILNTGKHLSPILIIEGQLAEFGNIDAFDQLSMDNLATFLENKPELLIIGSGPKHKLLPSHLTQAINKLGIAVESMASRQACHTYQVLSHDKRKVFALIFP